MFETRERRHDKFRWTVLEWVLYLDDGTVKEVRNMKKRFVAVIITLLHLVQVCDVIYVYVRLLSRVDPLKICTFIFWDCIMFVARKINGKRGKHHFVYRTTNSNYETT